MPMYTLYRTSKLYIAIAGNMMCIAGIVFITIVQTIMTAYRQSNQTKSDLRKHVLDDTDQPQILARSMYRRDTLLRQGEAKLKDDNEHTDIPTDIPSSIDINAMEEEDL